MIIAASTGGAAKEFDKFTKSSKEADTAFGKLSKSAKAGLVAGAGALLGAGLVAGVKQLVDGYTTAAKAAGDLASATGGNVEQVSAMQAALVDAGVSAEKSAGMLTKFTTVAGSAKGAKALKDLNVELVRGADGAVDYAATMVDAVDAISQIGDASERNRQLVALFGKQGAQAFQDLMNSGLDMSEAMALIDTGRIFTSEDVANAAAYDDAMDSLSASAGAAGNALGRALVPAINALLGVAVPLVDVLAGIPVEVYLVIGAAVALRAALTSGLVTSAVSSFATALTGLKGVSGAGIGAGFANLAKSAGPMLVLVGAITAVTKALQNAADIKARATDIDATTMSLREQAEQLVKTDSIWNTVLIGGDVERAMGQIASQAENAARAAMENADATDAQKQSAQALLDVLGDGTQEQKTNNLATEEGRAAQEAFALSLSASEQAASQAAAAQKSLADVTAEYLASAERTPEMLLNIANSAIEANEATLEQKRATNLAEIAMGEYAVSIQGTVEWQKRLSDSVVDTESQLGTLQDTLGQVGKVVDDPKTWENEVVINTAQAESDLLDYIGLLAASGLNDEQITTILIDLKSKTGKSGDRIIQDAIDEIKGQDNEVPVDINATLDPESAGKAKADAEAAVTGVEAEVGLNLNVKGREDATNVISGFTGAHEIPLNVNVKGRGDAENVLRGLSSAREVPLNVNVKGRQDAENVLNGLDDAREVPLNVNVRGRQDAENVLNGLDNPRDVYIRVHLTGVDAARSTLSSIQPSTMGAYLGPMGMAAGPAPTVYNQSFQIDVSGAGSPASTAREIDRYVRRAGDRSRVSVTQ